MKAAPFDYLRPDTVDGALAALAEGGEKGEDIRVLAGGQSLVPVMALRLATPQSLVDISRCPELTGYEFTRDGTAGQVLRVGAAVTDRRLENDPQVRDTHPLLATALSLVAHPEIRARGTLCGSLAHADPAAELPALLLATGGEVEVRGPSGDRAVAAGEFFLGPFTTALAEGEMIVSARLPVPAGHAGWAVEEIARRRGDFAIVGVVCVLEFDDERRCSRAGIALFGVAAMPVRCRAAEERLVGEPPSDDVLDAAAAACFEGVDVLGDEVHASADYRRRAGTSLVRRALAAAVRRAEEGT